MRTALYLVLLWTRYAAFGSWAGAFGWAGAASSLIFYRWGKSPVVNHFPNWLSSLVVNPDPFKTALVCIGLAVGISLVFNAVVLAPFKAWWTVYPLVLRIEKQKSVAEIIQATLEKHVVWVFVKNRSPLKSLHYTLSILQNPEIHGNKNPWPVHSGDIPPRDEHRVVVAQWVSGEGMENGDIVTFPEKPSGFVQPLRFPQDGYDLCLSVRSHNLPEKTAWCRVFVDKNTKKLVLEKRHVH